MKPSDRVDPTRLPNYVPPSKPWEMSEVLLELLRQALVMLKPGGRLVSDAREAQGVHVD